MGVINRKIDDDIITELNTGSIDTGADVTADIGLVMKAKTILGNDDVPWDGNICALITPAMEAYLMQTKEFSNREYVRKMPFEMADPAWRDQTFEYYWLGVWWVVHPNLPGSETATENCFMFHKTAIGHAYNADNIQALADYDKEMDYSWARTTIFMGSQTLQTGTTGIVVINHDGSAFAPS